MKYTPNESATPELQEAYDSILQVLKYVNDVMHTVSITGYDVSLIGILQTALQSKRRIEGTDVPSL